ncbi:MAG TPA: ACP S-malonyltransferase, partial [Kiritimatiellae bacterium]|nr:ACP S-malonyltransferase [Kiritimatiellia bacterium]
MGGDGSGMEREGMTPLEDSAVGLLFPGQGTQEVGMGHSFREADTGVREMFQKADEVLGYELSRICLEGPVEELMRADRAQPAIFVVSVAALNALRRRIPQLKPACAAGLSSGEWAALHAAGAVGFEDALRILQARGRFMQEACETSSGGMTSIIGLPAGGVVQICRETGVQAANFNAPLQTVISGPLDKLTAAEEAARQA